MRRDARVRGHTTCNAGTQSMERSTASDFTRESQACAFKHRSCKYAGSTERRHMPPRYFDVMSRLTNLARAFRKKPTKAEATLWQILRSRRFSGVKFRRQVPFERYILDFYAHTFRLVIELDGGCHDIEARKEHDLVRTNALTSRGIVLLRIPNEELERNPALVCSRIDRMIRTLRTYPVLRLPKE